jgi:hypothetical protein
MPEQKARSDDKGYDTLEYANEQGGHVGSLTIDELYEVLDTIQSKEMAEQIRRSYSKRQE